MARILLTRSREGNSVWSGELRARGFDPVSLPCLRHVPVVDAEARQRAAQLWQDVAWVAFTSARGVEAGHGLLEPGDLGAGGPKIAAVGAATAEACRRLIGRCDLEAAVPTARGLAQELARHLTAGDRVATWVADRGRRDVAEVLTPLAVEVDRLVVYRTLPAVAEAAPVDLSSLALDGIFVASPSAIEGLVALARWPADWGGRAVAIGPTTARALVGRGFRVSVAEQPCLAGMLKAWTMMSKPAGARPPENR